VKGISIDGFVAIQAGMLGDCNGDGGVNAADLSAIVLEIFDGDGQDPLATPLGTFPGNAVGCNPNRDDVVDAADISCDVSIIWNGSSAGCTGSLAPTKGRQASIDYPVKLDIPDNFLALPGSKVTLPVTLNTQGKQVNSAVFSVDYDQSWLSFDNTDANHDGVPDAVTWQLPDGFLGSTIFDPTYTDGELGFAVFTLSPNATLKDGTLMYLTLDVSNKPGVFVAQVKSATHPQASFGSPDGQSLQGVFNGGSVEVVNFLSKLFLPFTTR
jgi:hypothetical protein